jgi:hypothetical protein
VLLLAVAATLATAHTQPPPTPAPLPPPVALVRVIQGMGSCSKRSDASVVTRVHKANGRDGATGTTYKCVFNATAKTTGLEITQHKKADCTGGKVAPTRIEATGECRFNGNDGFFTEYNCDMAQQPSRRNANIVWTSSLTAPCGQGNGTYFSTESCEAIPMYGAAEGAVPAFCSLPRGCPPLPSVNGTRYVVARFYDGYAGPASVGYATFEMHADKGCNTSSPVTYAMPSEGCFKDYVASASNAATFLNTNIECY